MLLAFFRDSLLPKSIKINCFISADSFAATRPISLLIYADHLKCEPGPSRWRNYGNSHGHSGCSYSTYISHFITRRICNRSIYQMDLSTIVLKTNKQIKNERDDDSIRRHQRGWVAFCNVHLMLFAFSSGKTKSDYISISDDSWSKKHEMLPLLVRSFPPSLTRNKNWNLELTVKLKSPALSGIEFFPYSLMFENSFHIARVKLCNVSGETIPKFQRVRVERAK